MISSALTLNQKPLADALAPPPPNGLPALEMPGLEMPNAVTGEVTSCESRRRMSSVISSEPIQTWRGSGIPVILASACSCCGVHTRVELGVETGEWIEWA